MTRSRHLRRCTSMFSILKKPLFWQPSLVEFTEPLRVGATFKVRLDRFPKGVDNAHIDVVLSPEFQERARLLTRSVLQHEMAENQRAERSAAPEASDVRAMQDGYVGMMELAIDKARRSSRPELIQLLQFATIKFLLFLVIDEYAHLRSQLQKSLEMRSKQSSSRSVALHEQLVDLTKEEPTLLYRVSRRLFREILKLEDTHLSKLRKSVFGQAWQVPRQLLFNPLLKIPSLWADEQLMHHYSLVCTDKDDPDGFGLVNRLINELFSDYLPSWTWPLEHSPQAHVSSRGDNRTMALRQSRDEGVQVGFLEIEMMLVSSLQGKEYERGLLSWLDFPANLERIFYSTRRGAALDPDHGASAANAHWSQGQWPEFHHRLLKRIFREVRHNGLERRILACNAAPEIFEDLNGQVPVRIVCRYLEGVIPRRDMLRRLEGVSPGDSARVMSLLHRAQTVIHRMSASHRRPIVLRFLTDFARFRRDLKLAYRTHWTMNRIRLLERSQDIDLSRSNGTLHEFLLRDELKPEQERIRAHVIVKADLRGSTVITRQLVKRNLNPAAHFSLNFFEPINRLIAGYGAKKVFVEGDAVILCVLEYEDKPYNWLCVSRACGLARKILLAMDEGNARSRREVLPELELGLGIAFCDQAPTYLYDEDREIMISPAINRADQLSSCSAMLRKSPPCDDSTCGVEVLAPAEGEELTEKESNDRLLRYNVNGIELDAAAFHKLKSELTLKQIQTDESVGGECYHIGRYPDLQGTTHWLVIRDAPVRVWENGAPGAAEWRGRRFYQVVTDASVTRRLIGVLDRLSPDRGNKS